jgi:hypothetical protein
VRQLRRDGVAGELQHEAVRARFGIGGWGSTPGDKIELRPVVCVLHEDHVQQAALVTGQDVVDDLAAVLCRSVSTSYQQRYAI